MDAKTNKVKIQLDKIDSMIDRLIGAVDSLKNNEGFKSYLDMIGKFHNYSWHNIMLIYAQKPNATRVAGFRKWKSFGRTVRKGEKGIAILCPNIKKIKSIDENGKEICEEEFVGFFISHVFDISQTEGEPLPESPCKRIGGDEHASLYKRLQDVARRMGIEVKEVALPKGNGGLAWNGNIEISTDIDLTDRAHVLSHELSHILLHIYGDEKIEKSISEWEAETSAYVVSTHYGIDAIYHSSAYLFSWGTANDKENFKKSLGRIRNTAAKIISALDDPESVKPLREKEKDVKAA